MNRNNYNLGRPSFILDQHSMMTIDGRQVDWANVPAGYIGANGQKQLKAGTVISEMPDGRVVPTGVAGAGAAIGLLATDANQGALYEALSGYGVYVGGVIYETLLPQPLDAGLRDALNASGTGWRFEAYADTRGA